MRDVDQEKNEKTPTSQNNHPQKFLLRSIIRAMLGGGQKIPRVIGVTFIQLLEAEDSLVTDNSEIF